MPFEEAFQSLDEGAKEKAIKSLIELHESEYLQTLLRVKEANYLKVSLGGVPPDELVKAAGTLTAENRLIIGLLTWLIESTTD